MNKLNICLSYTATLQLMEELSHTHRVPLNKWLEDDIVLKFWGDNMDKKKRVRDQRSDKKGSSMLNMFSMIVGSSRTPAIELSYRGHVVAIDEVPAERFLPDMTDVNECKANLVQIVSRKLTKYITSLRPFSKIVPKHILHEYSAEMSKKIGNILAGYSNEE